MSQLPQDWESPKLKNVVLYKKGKKPKVLSETQNLEFLPYVDIKAFEKNIIKKFAHKDDGVLAEPEDTLMVWDGARSGLVGKGVKGLIGSTLSKLTPKSDKINRDYLHHFFVSQFSYINSHTKGTGIPHVDPAKLWDLDLPLPPLEDQKRIADKLDSVLAKVEAAQARLDKIPTLLKRFRQSVLAAATSGELTKDWHESNGMGDWQQVKLKDVGKGFNYGSSTKSQPEGKIPVLRMGNLQGGKLDWEKLVFTSDDTEIEKYKLHPGDVLFNRTNSPELVGKTSIYRGEKEAIFAGYLIKVQGTDRLNTEYLNIQLNSPHARDYCWAVKTDGVSQSNINAKKLQAYEFEIPSIEEQIEIIHVVTELFSSADLVEKQYKAAKLRVDKMTQSILARAFSGKLFSPISEEDRTDVTVSVQISGSQQTKREQPKAIDKEPEQQTEVVSITEIESSNEHASEVFQLLKNNSKGMSAQTLFDSISDNTFNAIDDLFSELKKLVEQKAVMQTGKGESSTFKVIKK